jgi:uncharacterized protein
VIVVDANLLIYSYHLQALQHGASRQWLRTVLVATEEVRIPWSSIHAFLRVTTNSRVFMTPYTIEEALEAAEGWLEPAHVDVLEPGPRYKSILRRVLVEARVHRDMVNDAHLAALAIEHDATVYTADRDFQRFAGLRVVNPLI